MHFPSGSVRFRRIGRRLVMLAVGMELATAGIVLTSLSGLGTSPLSALPWVLSVLWECSFGTTVFLFNLLFILLQAVLLRRRFPIANLLQLPNVFVYSVFIDINMQLFGGLAADGLSGRIVLLLSGVLALGAGIFLQVRSKTVVQPGEGLVLALAAVTRRPFGTMKVVNDVFFVSLALAVSLVAFGEPVGAREGTLVTALLVGTIVRFLNGILPDGERDAAGSDGVKAKPAG